MLRGVWTAISGFGLQKILIIGVAAVGVFFAGKWGYKSWKDNIETTAYNQAVSECNSLNLQAALDEANKRAINAEAEVKRVLKQKSALETDKQELIVFMNNLDDRLQDLPSGDISPRTEQFLVIINERNKKLIEDEKITNE